MSLLKKSVVALLFSLGLFAVVSTASAQKALEPKPSPMALEKVMLGDTYVSITYSQPHRKDRTIFGELVPFGKIWRFGANEATQMTTTSDIKIGDKTLKAGTYSVFCTPEKDKWTLIFNSVLGQWGSYQYDAAKDVLKVEVPTASTTEMWEPFTIKFDKPNGKTSKMNVMWENTMISVPVVAN